MNIARDELNSSTGYNLRIPTTDVPPVRAAMKSARQFRASKHFAASIASDDPFTKRAVEEIKEAINKDESIDNITDDLQRDDYIPPNRRMMLKCQKEKWIEAEEDELRSFALNHVMSKKPSIPSNAKALPMKWIYTVKRDLKGNIVRYKARLIVQGFFQIFGVDYTDTYSTVAKFVSIRIILVLCVQLGLIIHTMDVDTAFLNAELDKDIWVKIPEGTRLAVGDYGIYKLVKSLYGLKQA
jgi:Reverse transcriptase (RNA-dependent DNA polymerase)